MIPYGAPLFGPLLPWLERLPAPPDCGPVASLAASAGLRTENGLPLAFVPPRADGLGYEERIWLRGEVETRPDNWHDFFNAVIWLAFPRAKAALNARHRREMAAGGTMRGPARDALTHFDECGLLVVSADHSLLELMRGFAWKDLFWKRRAAVRRAMGFFVFGHATCEQLLAPFRGITGKAIIYPVDREWLDAPPAARLSDLDARLAADFAAGYPQRPRDLQPVPLLGIPGMCADSEDPAYYDDTWHFRPGRRAAGV